MLPSLGFCLNLLKYFSIDLIESNFVELIGENILDKWRLDFEYCTTPLIFRPHGLIARTILLFSLFMFCSFPLYLSQK